jgi:hypothetical protein
MSENQVILSVIHHRQNFSESTIKCSFCDFQEIFGNNGCYENAHNLVTVAVIIMVWEEGRG